MLTIVGGNDLKFASRVLFEEPYLLAAPKDHRFGDLDGEPFIVRTRCDFYQDVANVFVARGIKMRVVYQTDHDDKALALVAAGMYRFGTWFPPISRYRRSSRSRCWTWAYRERSGSSGRASAKYRPQGIHRIRREALLGAIAAARDIPAPTERRRAGQPNSMPVLLTLALTGRRGCRPHRRARRRLRDRDRPWSPPRRH